MTGASVSYAPGSSYVPAISQGKKRCSMTARLNCLSFAQNKKRGKESGEGNCFFGKSNFVPSFRSVFVAGSLGDCEIQKWKVDDHGGNG